MTESPVLHSRRQLQLPRARALRGMEESTLRFVLDDAALHGDLQTACHDLADAI